MRNLAFLILTIILFSCSEAVVVDTIVHNASIYTIDDAFSKKEAMAIKDGLIVEIGAENQILNKYTAAQKIDAGQRAIYPGLIDAHCHFMGYGIEKTRINLVGTKSFEEVIDRISAYIDSTDTPWVLGRGWDQNDWENNDFPTNDTLNKLFPNHYIAVKRIDGHAYLATQNVMNLAGISASTSVNGGEIILFDNKPTGIVIDNAMQLITNIVPEPNHSFLAKALMTAQADCFKLGLTTVSDAGLSTEYINIIDSLQNIDLLKMRLYAMLSADDKLLHDLSGFKIQKPRLDVNAIKVYADGALGSRGAYLLEPYNDQHDHTGLLITGKDSLQKWAKACFDANFQMNVHCIGDGANQLVLDVMGSQLKGTNDRRWRIEHAQVVNENDLNKFSEFTIIPSVQPTHATSDMPWAEKRLGHDRIENAYAYRDLLQQNGIIALGTDFPVEEISPFKTLYAAVERKDKEGQPENGFLPEQKLTREEALKGMTIWAAITNFEDQNRGSLEVGKFADFVMIDTDLMTCSAPQILTAKVLQTWLNGELVYED
ncbi:MAG: amidohydrolase [Salibacteraceae bacterium]|jgi:predicted amidohydrolase YtcJ|nr:amidohydrolase [Salibacteraceae bacterium]MDP4687971.1 amidohydrolase [Salibacteraceae bacterium]MDP4762140.1 amidohydrolase [Salibacteraceae bacterium]MDP4934499.1 amidohydrolase [Salibacteraceae bacterium]MDP4965869.1 amidohydrolase [Salibacteraceae bacterium]